MRFCLLEQHLPGGDKHPFAQKMLDHFNNLNTPLRSVQRYPDLCDQELRFRERGWSSANARSLWSLWNDPTFVTSEQRTALNFVEPFDEWEEFVLFSSHYFLLIAKNHSSHSNTFLQPRTPTELDKNTGQFEQWGKIPINSHHESTPKTHRRRFGAIVQISQNVVGHHGGLGSKTRMESMDLYHHGPADGQVPIGSTDIRARMCHSMTALDQNTSLLVGGRTSPTTAYKDCWLLRERWNRVEDLPMTLFRHCATQVDVVLNSQKVTAVLVYGGKTEGNIASDKWMLWREGSGWMELPVMGHEL